MATVEGGDIALRCPRPSTSGRNVRRVQRVSNVHEAPLVRGANGAARRPYLRVSVRIELLTRTTVHQRRNRPRVFPQVLAADRSNDEARHAFEREDGSEILFE